MIDRSSRRRFGQNYLIDKSVIFQIVDKKVRITEVVLRDGNQSLLSTRLKLEDIIPIASKLDDIGYSSIESWGGAIFDSCVRYLDEDPWERLRELK